MTVHIALFRAINVGGHAKAAMSELREIFTGLGFAGTQTLLRSGNVVFNAEVGRSGRELEALVERAATDRLRLRTDIMIGTAQEWAAIIASIPFRRGLPAIPATWSSWLSRTCPPKRSSTDLILGLSDGTRDRRNWTTVLKLGELACKVERKQPNP